MTHSRKKFFSLLASVILACMLSLTACGGNNANGSGDSADSSASATTTEGASTGELFGKPWVVSQVTGNLPEQKPEAKDDLYTSVNYDYIKEHQGTDDTYIVSTNKELEEATLAAIKDTSRTDHDLEQLRLFFNQVCDQKTLAEIGFSEVQPYIDMIDGASSIEELNAVLASDEFPFTPFVKPTLGVVDMHGENVVAVFPNFLLCDPIVEGGTYYQESETNQTNLEMKFAALMGDVDLIMEPGYDPIALKDKVIDFEKAYGKDADRASLYLAAEYGAYAQAVKDAEFTLDELCALCPNLPMREMLAKCKKDGASAYSVASPAWVSSLNDLWTEDNLDTIKTVTKCKVLAETSPYRDKSAMIEALGGDMSNLPEPEPAAYIACNTVDTFAQVIAKEYVENKLGAEGKERLQNITSELIETYKGLVAESDWLDEESKQLVVEKLEHMTKNVLEPVSGYFDYSNLELTPTEEGGTLLSNYLKLKQYRYDCEAERIGKPATGDWVWFSLAPTTANAFYDAQSNSINILPGFATSTVYSNDMSDTEALVSAGWTIGHEISHGFDYTGSQIDAYGLPNPVFVGDALQKYLDKTKRLADYYSTLKCARDQDYDGQNVVGEAAADLSGLQACIAIANKAGDTDYNQFFERAAQIWAQVVSNEATFGVYLADTHPLMNLRANVNAQMFDEFYDTFGVAEGDGMYLAPDARINIWGSDA